MIDPNHIALAGGALVVIGALLGIAWPRAHRVAEVSICSGVFLFVAALILVMVRT